ncbi:MAG TPA: type IV secretion system DNA-binding domain-containing protein, partial [Bacillota bacterium]|nr:type IV secretion system DNA-binding domain-containing protein [Bacillota bacterium]
MTHPDARDFYIGREYDLKEGKISGGEVMYNPSDLTTHAVVTGMTGSGKTGLCIGLLEEAALKGLPAIIVDPKGDLTNLLLHFPDLAPSDFEPWIDPDSARIKGKSARQMAEEAATSWSTSIDDWGLSKGALSTLKAFSFAIYSPGSSSGIPVNILSSFKAPGIPWEGNEEALREKISSTV